MNISIKFEGILEKAYKERILSKREINFLLDLKDKNNILMLFEVARGLRQRYFDNRIFLYGFIYFSNYCRNDCLFCANRVSNQLRKRYRKDEKIILEACNHLADSGVHLIDLTMGEDPSYYCNNSGFELLLETTRKIKKETGLPLMISPGVIPDTVLFDLARLGVDWYACYQETHNRHLFYQLRPNQNYESRFQMKRLAIKSGLLIEEGIMSGVGESIVDIIESMEVMRNIGAHQVRVMSFIPQQGTPMFNTPSPDRLHELLIIAVLRLLFPNRLIPASLDIEGINNLKMRLDAGANVITSLIPPKMGLSGVAQVTLGIDEGYRTVKNILPIVEEAQLELSTLGDYVLWIQKEKRKLHKDDEVFK